METSLLPVKPPRYRSLLGFLDFEQGGSVVKPDPGLPHEFALYDKPGVLMTISKPNPHGVV